MSGAIAAGSTGYREALSWLFSTQLFGIKLGLESTRLLLAPLDVPGKDQRIIHVAGTNGKGSVCAMLDSVCRAAGYRTGLFTSPHLVTFRERIQVNGTLISEAAVADGLTTIRDLVAHWEPHPTFFEIATALALRHFRDEQCDVVVLETGMGGRLDATNAIEPLVSVLTPIDLDHQKWLGETLTEIAGEKAGIIKPNVPVVSAEQHSEAADVLRAKAEVLAAPLEFVSRESRMSTSLAGEHQEQNAALAVAAIRASGIGVDAAAIERGLANVSWPARFQRWKDRIVIDGAHNPAGARILVKTWREQFGDERVTIVLGILQDKDAAGIVSVLASIASQFVLPRIRSERAMPPEALASLVRASAPNLPIDMTTPLATALTNLTASQHRVLITGSLHFAGEALALLRGDGSHFEECVQ